MIYMHDKKLTVDGVDVYPDDAAPRQFWYIPGTVRMAERGGQKMLSYLWYTERTGDTDGTGFLNFEVDTAVPPATIQRIRDAIQKEWRPTGAISLAAVPYTRGSVSFSVLGPLARQAVPAAEGDVSGLYQSDSQLVWQAGSSSLVGDNAAVCSVAFTKAGKLAGAMNAALRARSKHIAAMYRLEFLAMRPAVTFTVKGTFTKVLDEMQASIGTQLPLSAFILDLGIQGQWQNALQKSGLQIEVVNYDGNDPQEGLKWAQQILLEYVLKNFFEVQIGPDASRWSPLKEAPQVEDTVNRAKDVELAASEAVAKKDTPAPEDGKEDTPGEGGDGGAPAGGGGEAVKEIVRAATMAIPKVNIRLSVYHGKQENSIDMLYSEKKARTCIVLPQALVGLDKDDRPEDHLLLVNRSQMPFGLDYPVRVAVPTADDRQRLGLRAVNVTAVYPVDVPRDNQQRVSYSIDADGVVGTLPLALQYDQRGSSAVDYVAEFIYAPTGDWVGDDFVHRVQGRSDTGQIVAMAESAADFLAVDVRLRENFVWDGIDQAVVTLRSKRWRQSPQVVFQPGRTAAQTLRVRGPAGLRDEPVEVTVQLRRGIADVHVLGPFPLSGASIIVEDGYARRVPVILVAQFTEGAADVTLTCGAGSAEVHVLLEPPQEGANRRVQQYAVTNEPEVPGTKTTVDYTAVFDTGETVSGQVLRGGTVFVKAP